MKIEIPKEDDSPVIYDEGPIEFTKEQYEYVKSRLDKPSWICQSCGLNNNYYNHSCARCRKTK